MERRIALKQLALAAGGLLALPDWANAWTPQTVQSSTPFLRLTKSELLADITETLIPASDTPGAKALGVPEFVQKMIADCYEAPVQASVKQGLTAVDRTAKAQFGQDFAACSPEQRVTVLNTIELSQLPEESDFYKLIKNLTIQGFITSEYVMTRFYHYNMIPGHFHGCVPAPLASN